MYWQDDGPGFSEDEAATTTYSYEDAPRACQEPRPGGFMYGAVKSLGADYNDCGGLCCADAACSAPDSNFGDMQNGYSTPAPLHELVQQCKEQGNSGCSCLCYGKFEGDFVAAPSPPPNAPSPLPLSPLPPSAPPSAPPSFQIAVESRNEALSSESVVLHMTGERIELSAATNVVAAGDEVLWVSKALVDGEGEENACAVGEANYPTSLSEDVWFHRNRRNRRKLRTMNGGSEGVDAKQYDILDTDKTNTEYDGTGTTCGVDAYGKTNMIKSRTECREVFYNENPDSAQWISRIWDFDFDTTQSEPTENDNNKRKCWAYLGDDVDNLKKAKWRRQSNRDGTDWRLVCKGDDISPRPPAPPPRSLTIEAGSCESWCDANPYPWNNFECCTPGLQYHCKADGVTCDETIKCDFVECGGCEPCTPPPASPPPSSPVIYVSGADSVGIPPVLGACPASSSPVTSKAECELAAASLGNPFSTAPPTETNPSTGDAYNKQCLEVKWGATLRVNWVDITYDGGYEHIDGGEVGLPPYPKQMCRYDEFAPSPPPVSPPASPPLPASPPAIVCTKYGTNGVEHGPGANMYWEDDSDNGDFFTYAIQYYYGYKESGVCQERRPGGFWRAGDFAFIGKPAGRDYEDCGGLCCDPSRLADGCFPLPRPDISLDQDLYFNPRTDDGSDTSPERRAEQVQECIDSGAVGCSCPCYGKKEGDTLLLVPPPPRIPPPSAPPPLVPPPMSPSPLSPPESFDHGGVAYLESGKLFVDVQLRGDSEWLVAPNMRWDSTGTLVDFGESSTLDDVFAECDATTPCKLNYFRDSSIPPNGRDFVMKDLSSDTVLVSASLEDTYAAWIINAYAIKLLTAAEQEDYSTFYPCVKKSGQSDWKLYDYIELRGQQAPPPATTPAAPPNPPPSSPPSPSSPGHASCSEFARRWDFKMQEAYDAWHDEGLTPITHRNVHVRAFSKQCWQYTPDIQSGDTSACTNAVQQFGLHNNFTWWEDGHGGATAKYVGGTLGGEALYSEEFEAGNYFLCAVTSGGGCGFDVRADQYEVHLDNSHPMYLPPGCTDPAYVSASPPDPTCDPLTEDDDACVTYCPASGEHAPTLELPAGTTSPGDCTPRLTRRRLEETTGTDIYNFDIDSAQLSKYPCDAIGKTSPRTTTECLRAFSRFTSDKKYYTFSEASNGTFEDGFRCLLDSQNLFSWGPYPATTVVWSVCIPIPESPPPSPPPPLSPCDFALPALGPLVSSCTSAGTYSGSNCSNAYDGIKGGLYSIVEAGGDLDRSWVSHDAANARLTLNFKTAIDINALDVTQRLYHGIDNQVTSISVVLRLADGNEHTELDLTVERATTANGLANGDSFTARVFLSREYVGVNIIDLYLSGVMDSDDAGISELALGVGCEHRPPHPPPASSPPPPSPYPPPAAAAISALKGGLTGVRALYGNTASVALCSQFCGSIDPTFAYSYYNGSNIPASEYNCECYAAGAWTVLDASSSSVFLHGNAVGPGGAIYSLPQPPVSFGYVDVAEGLPLTLTSHLAVSSSFLFTLRGRIAPGKTLSTAFGNVMRATPWRIRDCRPCLDVSSTQVRVSYYAGERGGWWKHAEADVMLEVGVDHVFELSLSNRRLGIVVKRNGAVVGEKSRGLEMAGDYPRYERVGVYVGKAHANDNVATNFQVIYSSFTSASTVDSHKILGFDFDSTDLLANSAKFAIGFAGPALTQANALAAYAGASPNAAIAVSGYGSTGAAYFDRHAMLVLQADETALELDAVQNPGVTVCAWVRPTLPKNTLFSTLAGYGDDLSIHYSAYFEDISLHVNGAELRANPTSAAVPPMHAWTHLCASVARSGRAHLYVNGTVVATSDGSQALPVLASPFGLGGSADLAVIQQTGNNRGFGGQIDGVGVWARQLSHAEVMTVG